MNKKITVEVINYFIIGTCNFGLQMQHANQ
jgi:hypothetical protein